MDGGVVVPLLEDIGVEGIELAVDKEVPASTDVERAEILQGNISGILKDAREEGDEGGLAATGVFARAP